MKYDNSECPGRFISTRRRRNPTNCTGRVPSSAWTGRKTLQTRRSLETRHGSTSFSVPTRAVRRPNTSVLSCNCPRPKRHLQIGENTIFFFFLFRIDFIKRTVKIYRAGYAVRIIYEFGYCCRCPKKITKKKKKTHLKIIISVSTSSVSILSDGKWWRFNSRRKISYRE